MTEDARDLDAKPDEKLWIDEYCDGRPKERRRSAIVKHGSTVLFLLFMYAVCLPLILGIFRTIMMWCGFGDIGEAFGG